MEMFSTGEADAAPRSRFVLQYHWGRRLKPAAKVIRDALTPFVMERVLRDVACSTHGRDCLDLECITEPMPRIHMCEACPLCGQRVRLVRRGQQFIADYICPVGSVPPEHRHKPRPAAGGYVYFVLDESNHAVKIGYSAHSPEKRLASLQTGHPSVLRLIGHVRGERQHEQDLHSQFKALHLRGEWFRHEGALATFIRRRARKP